jgi:hypothetical protein
VNADAPGDDDKHRPAGIAFGEQKLAAARSCSSGSLATSASVLSGVPANMLTVLRNSTFSITVSMVAPFRKLSSTLEVSPIAARAGAQPAGVLPAWAGGDIAQPPLAPKQWHARIVRPAASPDLLRKILVFCAELPVLHHLHRFWHIMYENWLDARPLECYTESVSPAKRICIVEKSAACYGKATARLRCIVPEAIEARHSCA